MFICLLFTKVTSYKSYCNNYKKMVGAEVMGAWDGCGYEGMGWLWLWGHGMVGAEVMVMMLLTC